MSFLDDIAADVHEALAGDFRDGHLIVPGVRVSDGRGGFTTGPATEHPVKVLVDDYSDLRRAAGDLPANDRKLLVLGGSLPAGIIPATGQSVRAEGRVWSVVAVSRDPAAAVWTLQAR